MADTVIAHASRAWVQEELENLRLSLGVINLYGLNQKVAGIHGQMMKEMKPSIPVSQKGSTRRIIRYSLAIAASLLIIFLGVEAYNSFTRTPERVFAGNFQHYELSNYRDNSNEPSTIEKVYQEKKFREVITLSQTQETDDAETNFLAALSYLELNENVNAIAGFRKVLALNQEYKTTKWKDQSEYYLALAYLKNKDIKQSLELFIKIKEEPDHIYHKKVTGKLLRQVKRLR